MIKAPSSIKAEIKGLSKKGLRLGDFVDEIPIGLLLLDTSQRVILLNRAMEALTGYVSQEAQGIPCKYILRSSMCGQECPIHQVIERDGSVCMNANILNRNREKIPVRFTAAPVKDESGKLVGFLKSIEDMRSVRQSNDHSGQFFFGNLIGASLEMQRVLRLLPAIAQTDSSVLITGETGSGKDYIAEAVHEASTRAKGPFVKVNCGALPESLLESELFGHQKGAFTGAIENKPGRFRLAHTGTLYLTEIGDLPLNLQVKLLSFLDDQVVYPLGSSKGVLVNVRIIAATHRDLEGMVRQGAFREDLLFRLNVIRLHLPPLSERDGDVGLLMDHFLPIFNSRFGKKVKIFGSDTRKRLLEYEFPGNVRELKNIVEFAVNLCDGDEILIDHLPIYLKTAGTGKSHKRTIVGAALPEIAAAPSMIYDNSSMDWAQAERRIIMEAMMRTRGNRAEAAKLLGWGRSTLWRKLKIHKIV